ncbi:unnamed protein product [Orchesella dallaii]|uniref:MICOS complex subunit MIC60 n=1 Tax=Orchesella dallaii TaxID=48710 RepID=A0ABP1RAB7_9HEXA
MNIPRTTRTLTLLNRGVRYSTGQSAGAQPPRPPPQQPSGGGKILPTAALLIGGTGAGLGAYYYYDPNAEVFKQARSALGLSNNTVKNEPVNKKSTEANTRQESKQPTSPLKQPSVSVPPPPPIKKPAPVTQTLKPPEKKPEVKEVPKESPKVQLPPPIPAVAVAAVTTAAAAMPKVNLTEKSSENKQEENLIPKYLLVTALRAQQEAISEAYDAKISVIQQEADRKVANASSVSEAERFVELKAKYNKASASLAAIEQGIEARQEQNTRAKRLRALWAQVNALHARVNHPEYHSSEVTSIDKGVLLRSIETPDQFVTQMVNSLPSSPVHSLESLKSRFYNTVEPVCKDVGLIRDGEGFSVFKYALGKVASGGIAAVRAQAIGSSSTPIRSTHEVLTTAKDALERSDLLSAAVAVNNLTGLPREVASGWLCDARTLLETNQTLFVLMTYAASNNVF